MLSSQTYCAKDLDLRIQVVVKGPVFVRFGVCQISALPNKGEAAQC